jgi:hypothetical protein
MTKPNFPVAFRRKEMVSCFALLLSMVARGVTQTDAISGKWGSDSQTLLDLKFDGTAAVTGIAYFYIADSQRSPYTSSIRAGTFNPESGVLRLEGEFKGPKDAVVQYVIDGQVNQDSLKVKFVIGGNAGTLTMKKQ